MRLVEQIGSGITRIRDVMNDEGLTPPEFNIDGMFTVTLRRPFDFEKWVEKWVDKLTENRIDILKNIQAISKTLKIIEFSNKEVEETCQLMLEDNRFVDLEDTIQYIMAKKQQCDLILSNDATFKSRDIRVISSEEFCLENKIELE